MDDILKIPLLYDIYGSLLTKRQQEITLYYYYEDLSLLEIGRILDISKQAVRDNLLKTKEKLETYELKLKLLEKQLEYDKQIKELLKEDLEDKIKEKIKKLLHYNF